MCEPTLPIEALKELKWSVSALVDTICEPGSAKKEVARLAADGVRLRINWIVANLEAANEGKRNMGVVV